MYVRYCIQITNLYNTNPQLLPQYHLGLKPLKKYLVVVTKLDFTIINNIMKTYKIKMVEK